MTSPPTSSKTDPLTASPPRRSHPVRKLLALLLLAVLGVGGWQWWERRGRAWWAARQAPKARRATYTVRPRDLSISVIASGSLKALKSEVIESKVEGKATIIDIVDEGVTITEEDVKNEKVLVELDSADLQDRLVQQEITFANAEAAYTQAKEAYDIQESQVESDTTEAKLNVKFGRLDLQRYVGETLAARALDDEIDLLKLAREQAAAARGHRATIEADVQEALRQVEKALKQAAADRDKGLAPSAPMPEAPPDEEPTPSASSAGRANPHPKPSNPGGAAAADPASADASEDGTITFRVRSAAEPGKDTQGVQLGGAALQNQRKLEADIDLAIEEFKRAADKLVWTARLESKGYVSQNELEADRLALKREVIALDQALTARDLFLRYEFPKEAEQFLSIYRERVRELSRVEARGRSALAQKEADRRSKEAAFLQQKNKLEKLEEQLKNCKIVATQPGIVVYATSTGRRHRRSSDTPIDKGVTVHENQEIIRMPDLSTLAVGVGIHESVVGRVRQDLPAEIHIDAMPELQLHGKVLNVSVLPSPKHWWNRDYMEFDTDISIEGEYPGLKPGMSAKVEIHVKDLEGVLAIPVQAVSVVGGERVVYVVEGDREVARKVELGESNDTLVEIRSGLEKGDVILSEAPHAARTVKGKEKGKAKDGQKRPRNKGIVPAKSEGQRPKSGQRPSGTNKK